MAAKPIERFIKKQIMDQGGWDRILERIASGETIADVARTLYRPDHKQISRNYLSMMLHADPARSAKVNAARTECAAAMVDDALYAVDSAALDRDSVNKAKVRAEVRLKVAGFLDRTQFGDKGNQLNVQVNVEGLHLDALRHRITEASKPLAAALDRPELRLIAASGGCQASGPDSDEQAVHTRETENVVVSASLT